MDIPPPRNGRYYTKREVRELIGPRPPLTPDLMERISKLKEQQLMYLERLLGTALDVLDDPSNPLPSTRGEK